MHLNSDLPEVPVADHSSILDFASATKRVITAIRPFEVSLVDVPAIGEAFAIIKNADGDPKADVLATLVKDLQASLESKIGPLAEGLAEVKKQLAALPPAAPLPLVPAVPAPGAGQEPAMIETALRKILCDAGVIKAPETQEQILAKRLDKLEADSKAAFGEVTKSLQGILDKVKEGITDPPPVPVPEVPVSQQTREPLVTDVTKAAGDAAQPPEGGNLLSSMLAAGFNAKPAVA